MYQAWIFEQESNISVLFLSEINVELNKGAKETPSHSDDQVKPVFTTIVNHNSFLI